MVPRSIDRVAGVGLPPGLANHPTRILRQLLKRSSVMSRRSISAIGLLTLLAVPVPILAQTPRQTVGVAFGGGSARGIAHIGVIKWFEEHRVPIDMAAGTSMGGLVGGAYATGMDAAELREMIASTDWDTMFGASSFRFKNIRRKEDARSYPSRLEFGLKGGLVPPTALNNGQQVDWLLSRIAASYYAIDSFDQLPTPFRTVAVDLRRSERVVIDRGPFALAMRATMSLPGIFPPVVMDNRTLVDGGALDNIPADVVQDMGAGVVIAVDVGHPPSEIVDYSLFGLMGLTIDSMMRANTRRALEAADITIAVDVEGFGSLDWRRAGELIDRGYAAAERMRDRLIPYALGGPEWEAWVSARNARRRTTLPSVGYLITAGLTPVDAVLVRRALAHHVGSQVDVPRLEADLAELSGLDRYQAINWLIVGPPGQEGLLIRAREKPYAPPFMMVGFNLENTTSDDFRVQLAARYLAFDVLGSGSELRIDGTIGSDPSVAAALYQPVFGSRVFLQPYAAWAKRSANFIQGDVIVAEYTETRAFAGGEVGVSLGRDSEVAGGFRVGQVEASVRAGDPGLPELAGLETSFRARWLFDTQDSPVVPSGGTRAGVNVSHTFESPDVEGAARTNDGLTQMEGGVNTFWTVKRRNRLFVSTGLGTSFDGHPLATAQFTVGFPFRLDAFTVGERRGDHVAVGTVGLLRQVARLPDFMGGPMFIGGWLGTGALFVRDTDTDVNTHLGLGMIADTLMGPVLLATSVGLDGGWRMFVGVGRVFR
jgi:NTE family protein